MNHYNRRYLCAALIPAAVFMLLGSACAADSTADEPAENIQPAETAVYTAPETQITEMAASAADTPAADTEDDSAEGFSLEDAQYIDLADGSVTIYQSGTYVLSGRLENGSVTVDVDKTADDGNVYLVLDNADITCTGGTPVEIRQAKNTILVLQDGSENSITQSGVQTADESFPTAALWSADDLKIKGGGSLTVTTDHKDGISGRDDVVIKSGTVTVNAADDGIVGKDTLTIDGGSISVYCGGDGLKASNEVDEETGILTVNGGEIYIESTKQALSGQQAVHITGGTITAGTCSEGIESPLAITIDGGVIDITSTDDGINIADTTGCLTINGGSVTIAAGGDGLDANGAFVQNGGDVVIESVGSRMENYIDCDGGYTHNGGTVTDASGNDVSTSTGMGGGQGSFGGHGGRGGW